MNPLAMDVLVAMRHDELRRLRRPRWGRSAIPEKDSATIEVVDITSVAHRVCGRFVPVTQQGELRCA